MTLPYARYLSAPYFRTLALFSSLFIMVLPLAAQKTVVQDAGAGRKVEMDYNAAGKVVQTRTIGADGKVQEKVDFDYQPGYLNAQQTSTWYWPNGNPRSISHENYDKSFNFTREEIQGFDEAGKQISGHWLTHDPWTGTYQCAEWNPQKQNYLPRECPEGEESSGGTGAAKEFTRDEVMQQLSRAQENARRAQKQQHLGPMTPVSADAGAKSREVGLVLPTGVRAGERISGRLVENPGDYAVNPQVSVVRLEVPFDPSGDAAALTGWKVEVPGESPQDANGPISLLAPQPGSNVGIVVRNAGNPGVSVTAPLKLSNAAGRKDKPARAYESAALCMKGELCTVRGPFSGDSRKTFAAFEERPATIVAETTDEALIAVPDATDPGMRPLVISEGGNVIAFPLVVGQFTLNPPRRDLKAGEYLILFPKIEGPESLADDQWRAGYFPASNLEIARQLVPGFQLPKASRKSHEEREREEKEAREKGKSEHQSEAAGGMLLMVLQNATPDQITLRSSTNNALVFRLNDESFKMGPFKFDLVAEATRTGNFAVKSHVIPFLAPVAGQSFPLASGSSSSSGK